MADATPIKAVFNASNVATGLAEFQSSDTVALSNGGTGVSLTIGTAGQALKVNSGGTAVEFGTPTIRWYRFVWFDTCEWYNCIKSYVSWNTHDTHSR